MATTGFWGDPTSTLDWCENNYEVTFYIAEFWNTVTNLSMIIPPIYGIYAASKYNFEKRFVLCYLFFLLIGVGSWMFHMTLKYEMQLLDELPMMYACGIFIYCLNEVSTPPTKVNWRLIFFLTAYCGIATIVYLINKNPVFHETMYGILVFWMMYMDYRITQKNWSSTTIRLFIVGIFMYLFAFFLWIIDNKFCKNLEAFRIIAPAPLRPFSQLHGWWHLLAGYSTYLHILANIYHRQICLKSARFEFDWDWIGVTLVPSHTRKES